MKFARVLKVVDLRRTLGDVRCTHHSFMTQARFPSLALLAALNQSLHLIAIDVTVNPTDHPNSLVDVGEKRFRTRYGILKDASTSHHATGKRKYGKVVWQPPGLADSVHSAATEKRVTFHTDHIAAIF